jgi:hypothetical protein
MSRLRSVKHHLILTARCNVKIMKLRSNGNFNLPQKLRRQRLKKDSEYEEGKFSLILQIIGFHCILNSDYNTGVYKSRKPVHHGA